MRFPEAQPPPMLRVLGRTSQKLSEERGEGFDCAPMSFSRKERAQYGIPARAGVERLGKLSACRRAANGSIKVAAVHRCLFKLLYRAQDGEMARRTHVPDDATAY